jgi:hypothetical protein
MKFNYNSLALGLFSLSAVICNAEITASTKVVSKYIYRGERLSGTSFQPAVDYTHGNLKAGFWSSYPMMNTREGISDPELNLTGSWSHRFSESISARAGGTLYYVPNANQKADRVWSIEPYVNTTILAYDVEITPKLYYNISKEGAVYELDIKYPLPIKLKTAKITAFATAGTFLVRNVAKENVSGVKTKNWGDYYHAGFSAPFKFDEKSEFEFSIGMAGGIANYYKTGASRRIENQFADNMVVGSMKYSLRF